MESLRAILASVGCRHVATYIQSGNAAFAADIDSRESFAAELSASIEDQHGFGPAVHLVSAGELDTAIRSNPYPDAASAPSSLHLCFLDDPPVTARMNRARELATATESFEVIDRRLYLHAPDGIGRSRLVKGLDRALGTNATARNWRTILKVAELVESIRKRSHTDDIQ